MPYAIAATAPGGSDMLHEFAITPPQPGPGEVLIRQTAIGVNFIDIYIRTGLYPWPSETDLILGCEGAGVVESLGDGVTGFAPGDRVAYTVPNGAYATHRSVPAGMLVKVPDGVSDAEAAAAMLKGLGLFGGYMTMLFANSPVFADPLREKPQVGGCCGVKAPFQGKPVWAFWHEADRRQVFRATWLENALFLVKWLMIAYLFEAIMVAYDTTAWVAAMLGGESLFTIILAALVGMPAYLNGYAAVGLMGGLVEQGMAPGAAMSFVIAGGVSSIPAAIAVWALVKERVFAAYLSFAFVGAVVAGMLWNVVA
ncbi:MAG: permease [Pseudomonadota bacterium]